jgi:hypothetical protein
MKGRLIVICSALLVGCAGLPSTTVTSDALNPKLKDFYYSGEERFLPFEDDDGTVHQVPVPSCKAPRACGDVVEIECSSWRLEIDDYFDNHTGERLESCGGPCFNRIIGLGEKCRRVCPPKAWKCKR